MPVEMAYANTLEIVLEDFGLRGVYLEMQPICIKHACEVVHSGRHNAENDLFFLQKDIISFVKNLPEHVT